MKQTCFVAKTKLNNEITSKKTNIDTTERNEGPVHNNKMNVKNEERGLEAIRVVTEVAVKESTRGPSH